MDKKEVKDIIENYQKNHIKHLEKSIQEKRVTVDIDEGEVLDPEDYSRQTEMGDLVMRLKQQLLHAKEALKLLQEVPLTPKDKVVIGSLTETEDMFFYVSVPTITFDYANKTLVGISTKAPIYQIMLNKTKGDTFQLGDKKYTILNVW